MRKLKKLKQGLSGYAKIKKLKQGLSGYAKIKPKDRTFRPVLYFAKAKIRRFWQAARD